MLSLVPLIFPYSAQILLENALLCRQNARLKNRLLCSKFCQQNLSKPKRSASAVLRLPQFSCRQKARIERAEKPTETLATQASNYRQ